MTSKVITNILSRRKSYKNNYTCKLAGLKLKSGLKAVIPLLLLIIQIFFVGLLYSATPANTIISNIVTASFTITTNTNNKIYSYSTNNLKVTNYMPVFYATNTNQSIQIQQTNQFVTFSHIITNSGNATNKLQFSAASTTTNTPLLYMDTNYNGILDPSEPLITNIISIPPNDRISIIVLENIPPGVQTTIFTDEITITGTNLVSNNTITNIKFPDININDYLTIMPIDNKIIYIFATDGTHNATTFNGTEQVGDLDVTVYVQLLYPPVSGQVDMYWDAGLDPDGSSTNSLADTKVTLSPQGNQWVGTIPASDPRIADNALISMVFEESSNILMHTTLSTNIFRYLVKSYNIKKSGTLLNSICYPEDSSKPQTTVLLDLKTSTHVTIDIYDLKGDKVRTLVDKDSPPGIQPPAIWDGRNDAGNVVGVGLYFIVLETDNEKEIFKVIIIK